MEEIDNRNRCCKLRLRGLAEDTEGDNIKDLLAKWLSSLVPDFPIVPDDSERAHRALGPTRKDANSPRVIIVCFARYDKEEILQKRLRELKEIHA